MRKLLCALALATIALGLMTLIAEADGPVVDLDANEEDLRIVGFNALDFLGEVTSGDLNNDGVDDLIVGASGYARSSDPGDDNAGAVYVLWGTTSRLSGTLNLDESSADLTVYGAGGTFYLGRYVATGDINNDGVDDLLIGADGADTDGYTDNGTVYVLFGGSSLSGTLDLYIDTADLTIYGAAGGDRLGRSIASCDVSGDGVDDLIIGAYQDETGGGAQAGAVYVIFGAADLSGTIELDTDGADFALLGDDAYDRLGRSVACGDVDGDGTADIIAGAYLADQTWGNDAGEVYVIYGSSTLSGTLDLSSSSPDVLLRGVAAEDQAGFYVASGDINGDGTDDLLIGAYRADVDWPGSQTGTAYVVYGGSLSATMNLSETADVTIYGAAQDDRLSRSLASGDFNGDGYDDILVGASWADPDAGRVDAGISYVIYGAPEITSTIYLSNTSLAAITVLGDDATDESGRAAGAGDLDGDGADDLIIGAVLAGGTDSGETYVVYGSRATTLTLSPNPAVVAAGDPVTFTATASNKFGDWDITHGTTFTITPTAGGTWGGNVYTSEITGTWTVTGTFQSLVATATLTVTQVPSYIVISPDTATIPEGGSQTYTAEAFDAHNNSIGDVTPGTIFTVDPGAGGTWAGNVYTAEVDGTWTITGTYGGHVDTATLTVTNVAPTADPNGPYTGDEGSPVAFDGSGSSDPGNDIATYEWDFDYSGVFGADASGMTANYTYADDGTYTVALRVTDDDGASDIATTTVTINNVAPTADPNGPYTGDEGSPVAFDGSGSSDPGNDIATYEWDFDYSGVFGADASGMTANYTYADDGTYTVALRVTDDDGASDIATTTVTINNVAPTITSVTNSGPVEEGSPVSITVTATDPGEDTLAYAYDWNRDGDFSDPGEDNDTYTWTDDGVYTITVQASDGDGGTVTDTTTITVTNVAPIAVITGPAAGNEGEVLFFDGSGSSDPGNDITNYEWDFDYSGGFEVDATGINTTNAYADDGTYTVALRVTDDDGASDIATTTVTINNVAPTITSVTNSGPVEEGSPVSITVTASDPGNDVLTYGFDWNNDADFDDPGDIAPQASNQASYTWMDEGTGTYTVHVQVCDDDTCTDTTHDVTVWNAPPTADAGGPYGGTAGNVITLDGSGSSDPGNDTLTYEWDLDNDGQYDDATGVTVDHVWNTAGQYTVGLRVSDGDGGVDTDTTQVTIAAGNIAYIVISPGTASITAGETQTYTAEAFDTYNNSLGDVTAGTVFSIDGSAGGSWTDNVYTAEVAGTWTVTGTYGTHQDTAVLTVTAGAPVTMTLTATPDATLPDGQRTFTITAYVTDAYGNPVANGTDVTFSATRGTVDPVTAPTHDGYASTTLTSDAWVEIATVQATVDGVVREIVVRVSYRVYLPLIRR